MKQRTKARQLLQIAYATYQRNEPDIAKDIFVLAMEHPSVHETFAETAAMLAKQVRQAVEAKDFERASVYLEALKRANAQEVEPDEVEPVEEAEGDDVEEMEEDDEGEASLSPGDMVEPPPVTDLAPAQVASLVALARKIKAGGHPDLALRITKALGL